MAAPVSFRFAAGDAPTRVVAGVNALDGLAARLGRVAPGRWFVVSSEPVFRLHGARLLRAARGSRLEPEPLLVPDGEKAKSWAVLGRLLEGLVARGLRRDGGLLALGGGTVGDVGGLAAALALRGIPVVQVPTTLLAAVDSSLGGKTAVDLPAGKNLVGAIHQPALVVADTALLGTLPERAWRSGLAEVVKSALLDAAFWRWLTANEAALVARDPSAVSAAVVRSLRMKARVVVSDPAERTGHRFILNLGHTIGHALETAAGGRLEHGEAVAWGLLAILRLSRRSAGLGEPEAARAEAAVIRLVQPPRLSARARGGWRDRLGVDKKGDSRGLRAVLLRKPGFPDVRRTTAGALEQALDEAIERYNPGSF